MKITSAKDYGHRVVVRVVEDDSIPQWVHNDGNAHTAVTSVDVEGNVQPTGLEAGTECHACRNNWIKHEFIFEGTELLNPGTDQRMNPVQLKAAIGQRIAALKRPAVKSIPSLVGKDVA